MPHVITHWRYTAARVETPHAVILSRLGISAGIHALLPDQPDLEKSLVAHAESLVTRELKLEGGILAAAWTTEGARNVLNVYVSPDDIYVLLIGLLLHRKQSVRRLRAECRVIVCLPVEAADLIRCQFKLDEALVQQAILSLPT